MARSDTAAAGTTTTKEARSSLLPAWLLASEAALASLNEEQARTQASLRSLRSSLREFDEMTSPPDQKDTPEPKEASPPPPHEWPVDVFRSVSRFMGCAGLLRYAQCSGTSNEWLTSHDDFWPGTDAASEGTRRQRATEWWRLWQRAKRFAKKETSASTVDGRREVLLALRALAVVTCTRDAARELCASVVTPFIEDEDSPAAIQELAAASLANFLAAVETPSVSRATASALRSCLTSPSARVQTTVLSRKSSQYCQGVACKHAARALLNLALLKLELPVDTAMLPVAMLPEDSYPRRVSVPEARSLTLAFLTFHASGSLKGKATVFLELFGVEEGATLVVRGTGQEDDEEEEEAGAAFRVHGSASMDSHGHLILRLAVTYAGGDDDNHDRDNPLDTVGAEIRRLVLEQQEATGHVAFLLWQAGGGDLRSDGFFGIWEICSPSNSFVLRRGGVCRVAVV
mmetsp:Transcript_27887/g.85583  ORF Transcript_27887/g.85583 Transcript_27887/m.85583 type:complete len:459 (-) Transcript_27887:82-1458(-)